MTDIVKGILDGAWALIVGWIFPAALSILMFAFVIYPTVRDVSPFAEIPATSVSILVAAVVLGVVGSALKTELYRILEGYTLWPVWLFRRGQRRQVRRRLRLKHTLNYAGHREAAATFEQAQRELDSAVEAGDPALVERAEAARDAAHGEAERWRTSGEDAEAWLSDPDNARRTWYLRKASGQEDLHRAASLPVLRRNVLGERLERYPVDDDQIMPTALGNAIRRFEVFGAAHYGLDQQRVWYDLVAVAPERLGKQIDQMRTAVDFFVSLFYGQLVIAVWALGTMAADPDRRVTLGAGAAVAAIIAALAYRGAVVVTDEWAYAVQALINIGRKPLADGLSLKLPQTYAQERAMWMAVGAFLRPKPAAKTLETLDGFRAKDDADQETSGAAAD